MEINVGKGIIKNSYLPIAFKKNHKVLYKTSKLYGEVVYDLYYYKCDRSIIHIHGHTTLPGHIIYNSVGNYMIYHDCPKIDVIAEFGKIPKYSRPFRELKSILESNDFKDRTVEW